MIQVHRSAAAGSRSFGRVQPRTCFRNLNVCSISNRRRNACQLRFTVSSSSRAAVVHSHSGSGLRLPGRRLTCSRMRVPSMTGSFPSWSSQPARLVSRWCSGPTPWRRRCRTGWSR